MKMQLRIALKIPPTPARVKGLYEPFDIGEELREICTTYEEVTLEMDSEIISGVISVLAQIIDDFVCETGCMDKDKLLLGVTQFQYECLCVCCQDLIKEFRGIPTVIADTTSIQYANVAEQYKYIKAKELR